MRSLDSNINERTFTKRYLTVFLIYLIIYLSVIIYTEIEEYLYGPQDLEFALRGYIIGFLFFAFYIYNLFVLYKIIRKKISNFLLILSLSIFLPILIDLIVVFIEGLLFPFSSVVSNISALIFIDWPIKVAQLIYVIYLMFKLHKVNR